MLWGPVLKGRLTCAACFAALAVLAGCGGASGTIFTAVEDSHSAMATAQLAVRLDSAGKLTKAATATALDDALKELQTSRDSVLRLAPGSAEERESVQDALSVLDGCTASLTTARDAVASDDGDPSLHDGDRELAAAVDRLSALMAKGGGT
ncbi:hypothetical protein QF038_002993 [Pseudarthrobacter sp. W1I19]|uniref:hypothetical protein n=1 Tax=Pseudarthrobacter sp. W1I19 TaxID=3042288 RepID=UPI00277F0E99|nr:hypothetical protein [Pseudarthrobacter sp. W1I19]MDQ0924485.1 hypothetical protein [Pseudarthrobacter sp. W1I19]